MKANVIAKFWWYCPKCHANNYTDWRPIVRQLLPECWSCRHKATSSEVSESINPKIIPKKVGS